MSLNSEKLSLSIIIPCYNEADNLDLLIAELKIVSKLLPNIEIIIVDNGSTDDTSQILRKMNEDCSDFFKTVTVQKNIGYGHGIMQGVLASQGDIICWCHADLQTSPVQAINAYKEYIKSPLEKKIVKGTRFGRGYLDTFFTKGLSLLSNLIFFRSMGDINGQPKLFSRDFLPLLKNYPIDFSLDLFFLLQAHKNKFAIIDIPVEFENRAFGEAKGGGSFQGKLRLIIRTIRYIFRTRFKEF